MNGSVEIQLPPAEPLAEPVTILSHDSVEIAREVERLALSTLRECGRQKALATKLGKPELIAAWVTAELQSLKHYTAAHSAREKEELKAGRTMQAAQVAKERMEFSTAVRELFRAMPAEVGPQANPTNPQLAMRAIERWFNDKLKPALAALGDGQKIAGEPPSGGRGEDEPLPPSLPLS